MYEKGKTDIDSLWQAVCAWVFYNPITLYLNWVNLGMALKYSGIGDAEAFEMWVRASREFDPAGFAKPGNLELMRHKWPGFTPCGITKRSLFFALKQKNGMGAKRTDGASETSTKKPTAPAYTETHGEPVRDARTDGATPAPTEAQKARTEPERAPKREDHWRDHVVKNPTATYEKLHGDGHDRALEPNAEIPADDQFLHLPAYKQLIAYLEACYKDGDSVGIVGAECIYRNGEKFKYTAPKYPRNVKEIKDTARQTHSVSKAVGTDTDGPGGACIKLNPYNGLKFDKFNLTSFSNGLAEGDSETQTRDEFLDVIIAKCALPIKALVFSGNKSYHAIFDVGVEFDPTKTGPADAQKYVLETVREYERRVKLAHAYIRAEGGDVDPQTVDPVHGTRLPGAMRDGTEQTLLLTGEMIKGTCRNWDELEARIKATHPELCGEPVQTVPEPVQTSAPATEPATKKDTAPKTDGEKRTPQVYTLDYILADTSPINLKPEMIRGLMREGGTLELVGPTKAGKSFMLTTLAICASAGLGILGINFSRPYRVLYLDPELEREDFRDRADKIMDALLEGHPELKSIAKANFVYKCFEDGDCPKLPALVDDIIATVQATGEHFDIVIFDSIYRFFNGNENDPTAWDEAIREKNRLKRTVKCAVFYSHHTTKGNQFEKELTDLGSGSNYQARNYDAFISLLPLEITDAQRAKNDWGDDVQADEISFIARHFPSPKPFRVMFDGMFHERTDELDKQLSRCIRGRAELNKAQDTANTIAQRGEDARDREQTRVNVIVKAFTDAGTNTLAKDAILDAMKLSVAFSGIATQKGLENTLSEIIKQHPLLFEKIKDDTSDRDGKRGPAPDKIRLTLTNHDPRGDGAENNQKQ